MTFPRVYFIMPVGTRTQTLLLPCYDALNSLTVIIDAQAIVTVSTPLVVGTGFHVVPVGSVEYI